LRPWAHERLGSLYLQVGDTAAAARHLAEFIELWKDADPELQPRVQAAQRILERLEGWSMPSHPLLQRQRELKPARL
jgi:hypothetical protein